MSGTSPAGQHFQVVTPSADRVEGAGSLPTLVLYAADGKALAIPRKQAAQPDSVAADIATMKTDFNALLAKLRLAGILS